MTDYALTGKKGTGKSKNAVRLIRDRYFKRKRLVVTNLDINVEPMFGVMSRQTYVRVPDKPTAFDLLSAGHGNPDSYEEDNNGALVLDEMATWLNTRSFGDKDRAELLDYFAHARKHGFDTYYIMQNVAQVDKQLREAFIEQTVRHTRFDKVRIPFIGGIISALFGDRAGYLPRFHLAVSRMGLNPQDLVADRATFIGKDIEACYDTRQVFKADYAHGSHSVLSPWHVKGRYLTEEPRSWWVAFGRWLRGKAPSRPPVASVRPVTVPDPAWSRVVALCRSLPPHQASRVMARYARAAQGLGACVSGSLAP
ncbi:zonular occludens toxin domain-containing protein [Variovorax sp. PBL-E5]|uniref:zonular occludens toxin domain-containing protein n=1 Tax=Variovorax sp. PBL-E5 TaxID=434014 RepID=UPI0013169609|nr:zonular occludens toxin domain-containing protein [Variovorax sp. PBL-E5]VTU36328.1 assembly protein [Variovorax sp. PBL-E5]